MKGSLQQPRKKKRLLLIDQQPLIPYGMQTLLKNSEHFEVVGTVSDGLSVLAEYRKYLPDIICLEPIISGMSGLDVVLQLQQRDPDIKVLLYTALEDHVQLQQLIEQGVHGIVLKHQPIQHIVDALHAIANHQQYLDPTLHTISLTDKGRAVRGQKNSRLSPRERQTLKLIAEGFRNREIAEKFSISIKTVESHRLNLMRKLDAHHAVELVNWARKLKLV